MSINITSEIVHFAGHTARPPAPAAVTIYLAWPVWHRVQTGAACPASGRRSALVLARPGISGTACAAACAAQPFRVRWSGQESPPAGYTAAAQPCPVSLSTTEKIKKAPPPSQNDTHLIVQVSKNSKKYKKAPLGA